MPRKRGVLNAGAVIRAVRKLKDQASGKNLSRLHRIESELMTVDGRKRPDNSKTKKKKKKKGKA